MIRNIMILTPFAQQILAVLINLISPGKTIYSRVPIDVCDEQCQKTPLCDNISDWKCKSPQFEKKLYEKLLLNYTTESVDEAMKIARFRSFTRPETYEEGLVRYAIIAQAIANISQSATRHLCLQKCKDIAATTCDESSAETLEKCKEQSPKDYITCSNACKTNAPWSWSRAELALMTAVVINQESGFRADVHGGTGSLGRGDCTWKYSNGKKAAAFAKNAKPDPSTCRSYCLGQINIGTGKTSRGWAANDLVGIDLASTERCVTTVADYLSRSRNLCTKWNASSGNWPKATFAAYGSGASCRIFEKKIVKMEGKRVTQYAYKVSVNGKTETVWAPFPPDNALSKDPVEASWPSTRAGIYQTYFTRYTNQSLVLNDSEQKLLENPDLVKVIDQLLNAQQQIIYMPPVSLATTE